MKFRPIPSDVLKLELLAGGLIEEKDSLFNPSFVPLGEDRFLLTLRKISFSTKQRSQIMCECAMSGKGVGEVSSAREIHSLDGNRVRDMKLFQGDSGVYATFNTGHPDSSSESNRIYVSKIESLESPMEVALPKRRRVEKNWGFFFSGQELWAIYSVNPLVLLRQVKVQDNLIHMREEHRGKRIPSLPISIGSQPITEDEILRFTVHLKPSILKLRFYLPKIAEFHLESREMSLSRVILPLRHASLAPSRWNPLAIGINYASGFAKSGNDYLIGFGQADHNAKFGRLSKDEI